ncbi:beta strand repeat-containing protein [Duganella sp. Dugasp56]|uniref:beta strand repeat-containing protein n=1 Tax=Duganella sp. Dugasp56 TaxID=3243046 RepID=UPI0039AF868C
MAVAADYIAVAEQLYIAYFGRPADRTGLANMTATLAAASAPTDIGGFAAAYQTNATVKSILDSFGNSTESAALYTGTDAQFIVAIYQNVLNRDPLLAGLDFWTGALANHTMTRAEAATQIMAAATKDGGSAADAATVLAKTTVSSNFTAAIDTAAEVIAYTGKAAAQTARDMLHTVDGTTDTTAFNATVTATLATLVTGNSTGTTYTLATTTDLIPGTSVNDTIIADNTTLTAGDQINGGAGVDTLNFTYAGAGAALPAANITNVEVLNLRNVGTGALTLDASTITGVTEISADRSTNDITLTNVDGATSVSIIGNGTVVNGAVSVGYASTSSTATINLKNGVNDPAGAATVTISTANTKAVVNSTGADNTIESLALGGANTSLTINATTGFDASSTGISGFAANAAVTVTGAGAVALGTLDANIVTVDASTATGGLSAVLDAGITSFKGTTGADTVTTAATTASGASIAGGAGTDTLILAAVNDITTSAKGALYTGFETLQSKQTSTFDASFIAGVTTVQSAANGAGFSNLTAGQSAAVALKTTQTTVTYSLKDATGTADVLGLVAKGGSASTVVNIGTGTIAGYETLNLTVSSGLNNVNFLADGTTAAVASTNYDSFAFAASTDLKTVKVSGAYGAAVTIAGQTKVTSLDASTNTAGVDLTTGGQTGALVVTATAAADKIVVGAVGAGGTQSIDAGAGNDKISGTQANIAAATIKGGAGTDTLTLTDTGTVVIADNSFVNLTGVEKIALGATTGLTWTVGGYANAIATANAGVLDITATSLATTAAVAIDGSGLGGTNSLKLTLKDTAGTGAFTITESAGADNIKITTVTSGTGAITIGGGTAALTSTAVKTIDLSGVAFSGAVSVTTGAGNDIIKGGATAETITAGKGADVITLLAGHAVVNALVVAAGDSTQTSMDLVSNFGIAAAGGSDTLALGTTAVLTTAQMGGSGWTLTAGIATKTGATVADFLAAATTSGTAGVVAFTDGTNTYVVASEGTSATTDTVVELVGVTTATAVANAAGATTIHIV